MPLLPWKRKRLSNGAESPRPEIPAAIQEGGSSSPRTTVTQDTRNNDTFGLHILEDQDDNDPDAVDIVALHGLNGHWETTWQSTTSSVKGRPVMWLRDFLPEQVPRARIMSFGYDSALFFGKSVSDVDTFAEQLLEALLPLRLDEVARRPIIFICHSLGGIVVKKAIIRAHEKDRYQSLLHSVRGIVFFGTPHRGSSLAVWSTVLGNIASVATFGSKTNRKLSQDLKMDSVSLQSISKSFVDRAKNLQIISFYETDKMDYLNCRVVEEDSAVLGFPDEVSIGIKGNHRSMCRFDSILEPRYRCVWTNLQNLAGSASRPKTVFESDGPKRTGHGNRSLTKSSQSIQTALESQDDVAESINQRELDQAKKRRDARDKEEKKAQAACYRLLRTSNYEAHKDRYPPAVPGTCQWLLHHEKYREWGQKQASDLLWISADPGCGKSVLISYLIDHLNGAENRIQVPEVVCYFFFKEDNHEQNNAVHAVSAILHQLYTAQPWLLQHVTHSFLDHGRDVLQQFSSLWSLLDASVTDPASRDVILIFDALDECETTTQRQLLQSLVRFYKTKEGDSLTRPPFVKTIIASRPDNEIKHAFDILPTIRLRGEDEPEAISRDVELVIDHHIENAVRRGLPRGILEEVRVGLIQGADRTFLWTTLVINLLEAKKGASKRELMEILQARGDIFRIYERLLEQSTDAVQALRLLHIVMGAVRPLTLTELSIAIAVDRTQTTFEDLELDVVHNFEERAKALCGHFIRIVRGTVYLVHQTAREFLLDHSTEAQYLSKDPKTNSRTTNWQQSVISRRAHNELLDICLKYLSLLNVGGSEQSLAATIFRDQIAINFLRYAGHHWTYHYHQLAPDLTETQLDNCARLCNANTLGFGSWFWRSSESARHPDHKVKEGTAQRDIAYHLGLNEVVKLMDRMLMPEDLEQPGLEPKAATGLQCPGALDIASPTRMLSPDDVVHPHTISPGHLSPSPFSEAVEVGFHLTGRRQSLKKIDSNSSVFVSRYM